MLDHELLPARGIDPSKGLFRTTLAGQGHTLQDAFANLECAHRVERVVRHPARNMFGARVALHDADGQGYWDFMRAREDMYVVVENYSFKDPRMERIADDGILQFYFELSGDLTMTIPGAKPLHLNRPTLLIYHQQRGMEFTAWTAPSARQRSVIVNVRPQFLLDTFLGDGENIPTPLQWLLNGGGRAGGAMRYCELPLSGRMVDLVANLVEAPYVGVIGLVNTEALVMELLCAGVAHVGLHANAPGPAYSSRELRCFHAARDILMKEMAHPPTIRDVARAVGLNQTTLKQGFKTVFGEAPFELSVRCRMQRALELLREQRVPVARIAEVVGYRHPTSFATAFRRHFGIQPQQVGRQSIQPSGGSQRRSASRNGANASR